MNFILCNLYIIDGSRTPHYGNQTPGHDGGRTPSHSNAWDPSALATPAVGL